MVNIYYEMFKGDEDNTIIMNKEGRFLILKKPSDTSKSFRYDLKNGVFERISVYKTVESKITEVKVPNITRWFKNAKIVTDDLAFARLVTFLSHYVGLRRYKSPVRFIQHLDNNNGRAFEEWDRIGVRFDTVERFFEDYKKGNYHKANGDKIYHHIYFSYRPSDYDKEKLNYIKKIGRFKNFELLSVIKYGDMRDLHILNELKEYEKQPQYMGLFDVKRSYYSSAFDTVSMLNNFHGRGDYVRNRMIESIKRYNLDIEAFVKFANRLKRTEGVTIEHLFNGNDYGDYLRMEYDMKNGNMPKMIKYPRNFYTTFHLTKEEYKHHKEIIDETKFYNECNKFRELEYNDRNYQIVVPKHKVEIEIEADELKHCVRSYISQVVNGKTLIVFCRDVKDVEKPLVTIEVKNGYITQAYGLNDSKPKNEILDFIRKWARLRDLKISWCWD